MCDVSSTAVFCSKSIECFPCTASKFFLEPFDTILLAPFVTGIIIHFVFHICCICVHKLLYCSFFSASFYVTFLFTGFATSISMHVFSFFVFNYYMLPICHNFCICVHPLIPEHCHIFMLACMCVFAYH